MATLTVMPLNFNGRHLLECCLPSWLNEVQNCQASAELWVLDNASSDDSQAWMSQHHPDIKWLGFEHNRILATYNRALALCESPYVMILNNDVQLREGCLDALLEVLSARADLLGVMPRIEADKPQERVRARLGGRFFHGHLGHVPTDEGEGPTLYLHGAAMVVDRQKFLSLGGFDELFFYQEDNDLSYRAWRRGWGCWFQPRAEVYHLGSQTTSTVHRGVVDRRAIKEKANHLFVLKNVQNGAWLLNFWTWSVLKLIKMVLTFDRGRAWAWWETLRLLPALWRRRREQPALDDLQILDLVQGRDR